MHVVERSEFQHGGGCRIVIRCVVDQQTVEPPKGPVLADNLDPKRLRDAFKGAGPFGCVMDLLNSLVGKLDCTDERGHCWNLAGLSGKWEGTTRASTNRRDCECCPPQSLI